MKKQIQWLQNFTNDKKDSIWYGNDLVTIQVGKRYQVTIGAYGDVRAIINGNYYTDKGNGGNFSEYLEEEGIHNDKELQQAIKEGRVVFENNNWFEAFIWDDKDKDWVGDSWDMVIDELDRNDNFDWLEDWIKQQVD